MKKNLITLLIVAASILLISCGEESVKGSDPATPTEPGKYSAFINSQELKCDESDCPESVAKIISITSDGLSFCTATLIDSNKMVTSATCIPKLLRHEGLSCPQIYVIFPSLSKSVGKEISRCVKIESANSNQDDEDEAALWRSNLVTFTIEPLTQDRFIPMLTKRTFQEKDIYNVWRVEVDSEKLAHLVKEECSPVHRSYANPFAKYATYPHMPLAGCSTTNGSEGAAAFDDENELIGVMGLMLDESLEDVLKEQDLLIEEIAPIKFATSARCVLRPRSPECTYRQTQSKLDDERKKILEISGIHEEKIIDLKAKMKGPYTYLSWNFEFKKIKTRKYKSFPISANCFVNKKEWIMANPFSRVKRNGRRVFFTRVKVETPLPFIQLETKLDSNLKAQSHVTIDEPKEYPLVLNAWEIYSSEISDVNLETSDSSDDIGTYSDVPTDCNS